MKKSYLLIIILFFARPIFGQTPATDPHWVLDWHDEFNFFDTTIWIKGESLRATQYIVLRPGFEVPEEGTLFLDVCPCP